MTGSDYFGYWIKYLQFILDQTLEQIESDMEQIESDMEQTWIIHCFIGTYHNSGSDWTIFFLMLHSHVYRHFLHHINHYIFAPLP